MTESRPHGRLMPLLAVRAVRNDRSLLDEFFRGWRIVHWAFHKTQAGKYDMDQLGSAPAEFRRAAFAII